MKRVAIIAAIVACALPAAGQEPSAGTAPSFSPVTWEGWSMRPTSPTTG